MIELLLWDLPWLEGFLAESMRMNRSDIYRIKIDDPSFGSLHFDDKDNEGWYYYAGLVENLEPKIEHDEYTLVDHYEKLSARLDYRFVGDKHQYYIMLPEGKDPVDIVDKISRFFFWRHGFGTEEIPYYVQPDTIFDLVDSNPMYQGILGAVREEGVEITYELLFRAHNKITQFDNRDLSLIQQATNKYRGSVGVVVMDDMQFKLPPGFLNNPQGGELYAKIRYHGLDAHKNQWYAITIPDDHSINPWQYKILMGVVHDFILARHGFEIDLSIS